VRTARPRWEEGDVRRPRTWVPAVLLLLALLAACGSEPDRAPSPARAAEADVLTLASYDFQENQILAEVYAEAARRAGVPVQVQHAVGTREVVSPALAQGVVDVVIDYLGTAVVFARPGEDPAHRKPDDLHAVLERTLAGRGITVLDPARAEDQNGFAVTADFVVEHDAIRLSDLTPLAPDLRFGGPAECRERPLCLPGLERVYGLDFGEVRTMPSRAATAEALLGDQIDVGLLETTDARLADAQLVLLDDDLGLQPRENIVPLVRTEALRRWGDRLRAALDDVSGRLTTDDLVQLNQAVELQGLTPAEAAARWWDQG